MRAVCPLFISVVCMCDTFCAASKVETQARDSTTCPHGTVRQGYHDHVADNTIKSIINLVRHTIGDNSPQ